MNGIGPAPNLAIHAAREQQQLAQLKQATQQFESMLLQRVLGALQKTARISSGSGPAGASAYGSMVVEALSDAIAQAGGLGLARDVAAHVGSAQAKKANSSSSLDPKQENALKPAEARPFTHVRMAPTEPDLVLVNRRK